MNPSKTSQSKPPRQPVPIAKVLVGLGIMLLLIAGLESFYIEPTTEALAKAEQGKITAVAAVGFIICGILLSMYKRSRKK